jgi:lipopolysaccharide transport system ATP-binding protein
VEIQSKFDRIVDFAEVEKFLDTPVKRYSSGMYVRLAFAVAAHLDPEILVVDEVLAVGDAQFQRKCLGKMEDVAAKEGKTVLFVSHNISAINSLCSRTILLNQGSIEIYGETNEVTNKYLDGLGSKHSDVNGKFDLSSRINPYNHGIPVIEAITVYDHNDQPSNTVVMGKPATIKFKLKRISGLENLDFGIGFYTPEGFRITSATTWSNDAINNEVLKSEASVSFAFDEIPFTSGKIMMSPSVSNSRLGVIYDHPEMSCSINVLEDTVMSDKKKISRPFGIVYIDGFWQI